MTAAVKTYRVTVRVVADGTAWNTHTTVRATNAQNARDTAVAIVKRDHRDARAVVGISQRRIRTDA